MTVKKQNIREDEYTYSFKNFRTINIFGETIYNGKITQKKLIKIKVIK